MRAKRWALGIHPVYKLVDTCAAEFTAYTPYYYSTYEQETEAPNSTVKKIMILGGGPNRIGQGIEFDYCCCHAAFALKDAGFQTIMVNSNPETVSTDYDTSDFLFFEPLTAEDVLEELRRAIGVGDGHADRLDGIDHRPVRWRRLDRQRSERQNEAGPGDRSPQAGGHPRRSSRWSSTRSALAAIVSADVRLVSIRPSA